MVRFCEGAPIIITGDIAGDCSVYRMHGNNIIFLNEKFQYIMLLIYLLIILL